MDKVKRLQELYQQSELIHKKRAELASMDAAIRAEAAQLAAEFRVGDTVQNGRGEQYLLSRIRLYTFTPSRVSVRYFGYKLKKDGTPGVVERELWGVRAGDKLTLVKRAEADSSGAGKQ